MLNLKRKANIKRDNSDVTAGQLERGIHLVMDDIEGVALTGKRTIDVVGSIAHIARLLFKASNCLIIVRNDTGGFKCSLGGDKGKRDRLFSHGAEWLPMDDIGEFSPSIRRFDLFTTSSTLLNATFTEQSTDELSLISVTCISDVNRYKVDIPLTWEMETIGIMSLFSNEPTDLSSMREAIDSIRFRIAKTIKISLEMYDARLREAAIVSVSTPLFTADRDGRFIWANDAFCALSGYSLTALSGQSIKILNSGQNVVQLWDSLWAAVTSGHDWQGEVINKRRDGTYFIVKQSIKPIFDVSGHVARYISSHEDVTELRENEKLMLHIATHDNLTDLPNRVFLNDHILAAIARAQRSNTLSAVMFFDLDRFKQVNDSLGHAVGDELLIAVAQRIRHCMRDGDTLARIGGDEFTAVLPGISRPEEAQQVAQRILLEMSRPFNLGSGAEINTSTSIGISLYPTDGHDPGALMRHADAAMYVSKDSGRNSFTFFTQAINDRIQSRAIIESELRLAIKNNEFEVYYQPQTNIISGETIGFEALVRWNHPVNGVMAPGYFIDIAEESGLIHEMGKWVLMSVCKQIQDWVSAGYSNFKISVNISAKQFTSTSLPAEIAAALEHHQINPCYLDVELTESMMMDCVEDRIKSLEIIRNLGVSISIDDFGTGYSSLSYLKRFPVDTLKIDQAFVKDVMTDVDDAIITKTIIAMAHSLGLTVVAEGVEDHDQLAFLRQQGCEIYQGYLRSPPVSAPLAVSFMGATNLTNIKDHV